MSLSKRKSLSKSNILIFICWLVYAASYVGKLSYNANISRIGEAFGVTYAETGMVSTFFFFVYGAGQIVNGILCKKYNVKYVVLASLAVSSLMNILVASVTDFEVIKYLWLINGASMSFLWTSLIRLLSEAIPKADIPKATVVMGTTVAVGTLAVYGISAAYAAFISYHAAFISAAVIMLGAAAVWILAYDPTVKSLKAELEDTSSEEEAHVGASGSASALLPFISVIAIFAISNNLIKDGLTAWTPDILSSLYETPDWLSILLTLLLPVLGIVGSFVAVWVEKLTKNFVLSCAILFASASVLVGTVIIFISSSHLSVTIICFALVSCLMAGVNNVITSMIPLELKDKADPGKLSGILNGFCYLGSTISSYGLGLIADGLGWGAVFQTLLCVALFSVLSGCVYLAIAAIKARSR